jgi:hypothetical protein
MYPPEYKFTTEHQSAKEGVPGGILANSDWHWDAKKKDHDDDKTFIGNVDYDWARLSAWALEFAKNSGAPQRWFRFDREKGIIYHSNEIVNNMPYYGQAKFLFETNGYNEHNTQYYKIKDKQLAEHFEPLWNMLNMQDKNMSLFVQMPGHTIPSHADVYSSFIRQDDSAFVDGKLAVPDWNNARAWGNFKTMRRYTLFVNDWDWGQFYHQGNHVMQPWSAGDMWQIPMGLNHGSANAGINPKITFHWSGNVDENQSAAGDINFKSRGPLYNKFYNL